MNINNLFNKKYQKTFKRFLKIFKSYQICDYLMMILVFNNNNYFKDFLTAFF